jgi:hypothetical protein
MKKTFLMITAVALLAACGGKEEEGKKDGAEAGAEKAMENAAGEVAGAAAAAAGAALEGAAEASEDMGDMGDVEVMTIKRQWKLLELLLEQWAHTLTQ